MMETVFFEDCNAAHNNNFFGMNINNMNINQLKRKMTLDLDFNRGGGNMSNNNNGGGNGKQTPSVIKKARVASLNTPLNTPAFLSSPDLQKLNMSSPEFEKFVIQQTSTLPTPTPNQSQIFFPKNVTEEQEQYVRGFTDALSKLQQQQMANPAENNNNNNNVAVVSVSNSNSNNTNNSIIINTSIATSMQQQQLVQTTTTTTTNSSNIQLLNHPQQQQLIQQQLNLNNNNNSNQLAHQPPPPPPYTTTFDPEDSSDVSDSMSENSCSNSTTSSSTYTTNGHVSVPGQQVNFPSTVVSGHHRLPDYQMSMGATGTSGNIAAIPVSAAAIGSYTSSHVHIKEETVSNPSSPPVSPSNLSPIDMISQEKIKLERKRQRNRVAASKCRKRKLERISKLEDKVKQLKGENSDLTNVLTKLKETVCNLKQEVLVHVNSGCQLMLGNQTATTSSF